MGVIKPRLLKIFEGILLLLMIKNYLSGHNFFPTSTSTIATKTKKVDLEELYIFSLESTRPVPWHQGDFILGRGSKS